MALICRYIKGNKALQSVMSGGQHRRATVGTHGLLVSTFDWVQAAATAFLTARYQISAVHRTEPATRKANHIMYAALGARTADLGQLP